MKKLLSVLTVCVMLLLFSTVENIVCLRNDASSICESSGLECGVTIYTEDIRCGKNKVECICPTGKLCDTKTFVCR